MKRLLAIAAMFVLLTPFVAVNAGTNCGALIKAACESNRGNHDAMVACIENLIPSLPLECQSKARDGNRYEQVKDCVNN